MSRLSKRCLLADRVVPGPVLAAALFVATATVLGADSSGARLELPDPAGQTSVRIAPAPATPETDGADAEDDAVAEPEILGYAVPRGSFALPYGLEKAYFAQLDEGASFPLVLEDSRHYYFEALVGKRVRIVAWPKPRAGAEITPQELLVSRSTRMTFSKGYIVFKQGQAYPIVDQTGETVTLLHRRATEQVRVKVRAEWFRLPGDRPIDPKYRRR